MKGDIFEVGDLVKFAIEKPTKNVPWCVTSGMAKLYGDTFVVTEIRTLNNTANDTILQRIIIDVCKETRNKQVAFDNLMWSFNEYMFELVKPNSTPIEFSYDDAIKEEL